MLTMPGSRLHGGSLAQAVARRQVRMHLRKIREREYSKLRALIPSVAARKKATKVQVVEGAVRYIEELHNALMERCRETYGDQAEHKAQETVQAFVQKMMEHQASLSTATSCQRLTGETTPPLERQAPRGSTATPLTQLNTPMRGVASHTMARDANNIAARPSSLEHRHALREIETTPTALRHAPRQSNAPVSSFERKQDVPSYLCRKGRNV